MIEPLMGMIAIYGTDWPPRNWASCNGQFLSIAQNQALFALLGAYYGGNGTTTFALPDLRGRAPVGASNSGIGEARGAATVTLNVNHLPAHNHTIKADGEVGNAASPEDAYWANTGPADREYKSAPNNNSIVAMNASVVGEAGGSQPLNIMQPYIAVNYCICIYGIFPSRN